MLLYMRTSMIARHVNFKKPKYMNIKIKNNMIGINDLHKIKSIIDLAARRSAFYDDEFEQVIKTFNEIELWIEETSNQTNPHADPNRPMDTKSLGLETIGGPYRLTTLKRLLLEACASAKGEVWELGVYRGGTASMISDHLKDNNIIRELKFFDSFEGLPVLDEKDLASEFPHHQGEFGDPGIYETVCNYFAKDKNVQVIKGFVPDTLIGLEDSKIAFCHIDLDLYDGYKSTLEFVWPRLATGGIIAFDDYFATGSCQGAIAAVDEFLEEHTDVQLYTEGPSYDQASWIIKKYE
jgi:O-methyltransferase